jgi:carboxymethylenebutenolidase
MGTMMQLTARDGATLAAYRAAPTQASRGGLIVVQEIFGVNSHIRSVCDGYAADGYTAIAPALFDRYEKGVELGYSPPDIDAGRALKGRAETDAALLDVAAARDAIATNGGKIGIVGYCWGGFIAWMAAARVDGLACAIAYYGGGLTDALDARPRCPVMAHFGERDKVIPLSGVDKLRATHPQVQVFTYPADHGFNCDQRGSYDASSAKLARERTLAFLRENVG